MAHIGDPGYTALDRECSPLVRFRTRDHAVVTGLACGCGRTALADDGGAIERLR